MRRCFICLLVFLVGPAFAQDWPQLRGARLDGASVAVEAFPHRLELSAAWRRELGSGYSGISVVGDTLVTMFSDGTSDFLGAYSVADGNELWRTSLGDAYKGRHGSEDGPSSTPCIAEGRVFATSGHGRLVAHALDDGTPLWSVDLVKEQGVRVPWYGFGASPALVDGVLYVPFGTRGGTAGAAFDPASGDVRWTVEGGWVDYQHATRLDGLRGLVTADAGGLRVVDPGSGDVRLQFPFTQGDRDLAYPQVVPVPPGRLLLAHGGAATLYAVDETTRPALRPLWSTRELKDSYAPPVAHDDTIYGLSGIFLVAVDAKTGERLWKSREPGARALILVDGHLVLLASDGDVVVAATSRDGYRQISRVKSIDRGGFTNPTFAAGRIFVRNTSSLAAVEIASADKRATADAGPDLPPGAFGKFVAAVLESETPGPLVDAWWDERSTLPLIDGDHVHFVYRGEAEDVAIVGDMTADRNVPDALQRLGATDLFYRSYPFPVGGRWQYAFLVDLERIETDPQNDRQASPVLAIGGNPRSLGYPDPQIESVVARRGDDTVAFFRPAETGGRFESHDISSDSMREPRKLQVYLPRGYDEGPQRYPTLYVLGGDDWLERTPVRHALDRLMGDRCAAAIVVFVPYHAGSRDRMGADDYARLVDEKVASLIEKHYRTADRRSVLATADDGPAALVLGLFHGDRFPRIAVQSPYADASDIELLTGTSSAPAVVYIDWSRYEPRILDENVDSHATAMKLRELLLQKGVEVHGGEVAAGPGWGSWVRRLDRVLPLLLPNPDSERAARNGS